MSEIDGIRTGITSSSITVFTTFLSTLLVEDELTTIFAATFSVMLANGISDAFAVGTSLKDGIDLTRDRLLVRGHPLRGWRHDKCGVVTRLEKQFKLKKSRNFSTGPKNSTSRHARLGWAQTYT